MATAAPAPGAAAAVPTTSAPTGHSHAGQAQAAAGAALPVFKLSRRRRVRNLRDRIWLLFEDPTSSTAATVVAIVVIAIIVLSTTAFVVQTLPQFVFTPNPAWDGIEKGTIAGACAAIGRPSASPPARQSLGQGGCVRCCCGVARAVCRRVAQLSCPRAPRPTQSSRPSLCCARHAARPRAPSSRRR